MKQDPHQKFWSCTWLGSISPPPAQVWPWLVQMRVHGAELEFILHEADDGGTRLLLRTRTGPGRPAGLRFMDFLLQPGYLVMDRAMLLGIKQRAERQAKKDQAFAESPLS